MPGAPRWHWSDEPFSYTKMCYAVPAIVFLVVLLLSAFGLDDWLPRSTVWSVVSVGLIAIASYVFFVSVVWRLLPSRVRSRTPYNRKEASEEKGDIRSFWNLCKALFSRRVPPHAGSAR